jgi:hypothetical protein
MATTGIGAVHAFFEADTKGFDTSVQGTAEQLKAAAQAAQLAGDQVVAAGEKIDRAATMQERAMERARRAWEKEKLAQYQAMDRDKESARARELAALKADILARSNEGLGNTLGHAEKAQRALNDATGHSVPQMSAASAAVRALEGNMTHNIRAAERFISTTLGLAPLLEKAFPIIGAVALGAAVVEVGKQLIDFGGRAEDLARTMGVGWLQGAIYELTGVGKEVRALEDDMKRMNEELDASFRKRKQYVADQVRDKSGPVEGAGIESQGLQQQINASRTRILNLEKQLAAAQAIVDMPQHGKIQQGDFERDQSARAQARSLGVSTDPDQARMQRDDMLRNLEREKGAIAQLQMEQSRIIRDGGKQQAADQQRAVELYNQNEARALEQMRKASEARMRVLQEEFAKINSISPMNEGQVLSFWNKALPQFDPKSPQFQEILSRVGTAAEKIHQKFQEALKKIGKEEEKLSAESGSGKAGVLFGFGDIGLFISGNEAVLAAQQKAKSAQAAINAEWEAAVDKVGLLTGAVTPLQAALDAQKNHAEEYRLQLEALREELDKLRSDGGLSELIDPGAAAKRIQLQTAIAQLENKAKVSALEDQQSVLGQTWTGMIDNVWDELIRKSNETQHEMQQIASRFVDSINSEFAKSVTGGRTNYSQVFRNASQSLAKTGFEKLEGSLLGAFGLGSGKGRGKPDGSGVDPFHVIVEGAGIPKDVASLNFGKLPGVSGPAGNLVNSASKGLLGALNDSNWLSSLFGGKLFGAGSIFGNLAHFAEGGPIPTGIPALVGENGPELFMPSTPGHIVSNDRLAGLGGVTNVYQIDAKGTDPALVAEHTAHAIRLATQHGAAAGARAVMEKSRRTPR